MAKHRVAMLDACFHALAHPVRRGMLEQLTRGPATVGALAEPHGIAAPTISKHLRVLEDAGLVARERAGREHIVTLQADLLLDATSWLTRYSRFWRGRLDALEGVLNALEAAEATDPTKEEHP